MARHAIKLLTVAASCLVVLFALPALAVDEPATVNRGTAAANRETISVNRAFAAASEAEREHWRKTIAATPRPPRGCFRAQFPDLEWHAVPLLAAQAATAQWRWRSAAGNGWRQ